MLDKISNKHLHDLKIFQENGWHVFQPYIPKGIYVLHEEQIAKLPPRRVQFMFTLENEVEYLFSNTWITTI